MPASPHLPQGAKHFKDIQYAPGVTYGEMFLQNEYEMSGEPLSVPEKCLSGATHLRHTPPLLQRWYMNAQLIGWLIVPVRFLCRPSQCTTWTRRMWRGSASGLSCTTRSGAHHVWAALWLLTSWAANCMPLGCGIRDSPPSAPSCMPTGGPSHADQAPAGACPQHVPPSCCTPPSQLCHRPVAAPLLQEARRMLAKRLPVPAYDHLLKLSHTFNLLDARGAVGVTGEQTPGWDCSCWGCLVAGSKWDARCLALAALPARASSLQHHAHTASLPFLFCPQSAPTALPPCARWLGRSPGSGWRGGRSRATPWAWCSRRWSPLRPRWRGPTLRSQVRVRGLHADGDWRRLIAQVACLWVCC